MSFQSSFKYNKSFRITPTILTTAYSADRLLCDPFIIPAITMPPNMSAVLRNLTVIDFEKHEPTLDFIFFNEDVSITNGPNQVVNASADDIKNHLTSIERVLASDYISDAFGATGSVASVHPINTAVLSNLQGVVKCAVITRKAFTATAADDITFVFDFVIE